MKVPIILLIQKKYIKELINHSEDYSNKQLRIQSLIGKDAIQVSNALKQCKEFDSNIGYPVLIIDESLCRGLDAQTSQAIEENGGIYVIVAKIP